jgi:hypothetical protein
MERLHKKHELSRRNRFLIESSGTDDVGCFHCLKTYPFSWIKEYDVDEDGGETAICPECDTDSVLPSPVTSDMLEEMHRYWFSYAYEGRK